MGRGWHTVTFRLAQPDASSLGGLQGGLGALADGLAFLFSDHGHDADRQLVGVGHVDRDELHLGLLQTEQEIGVARQPVELGDDQRGPVQLASLEGFGQRWTVLVVLAALNLDVLLDQLPTATVEIGSDRGTLRLKAEAGMTLSRPAGS
jgi:hypothetical protein